MASNVLVHLPDDAFIKKIKIKEGSAVNAGTILCEYQLINSKKICKLKSNYNGTVKELLLHEGAEAQKGSALFSIELCRHLTIWRNMCAECGLDLREQESLSASVAMEHMIPDLLISEKRAEVLGREDEDRLLRNRQLVLLVDLDQTLIHTTNDAIPPNLKDVYHFQLWPYPAWYHTKFRPHTEQFLDRISKLYELHICTFGTRTYAHTIARFLDPDGHYFSQRILSRDECFHPTLKTSNLKALFPCGDSMVCIIDDREDVWKMAPNLVHVRPYRFFDGTADINAPPEASKASMAESRDDGSDNIGKVSRRTAKIVRVPKKMKSGPLDGSPVEVLLKPQDPDDAGKRESHRESADGTKEVAKLLPESAEVRTAVVETDAGECGHPGDVCHVTSQLKQCAEPSESPHETCTNMTEQTTVEGNENVSVEGTGNAECFEPQRVKNGTVADVDCLIESKLMNNNTQNVDSASESGKYRQELDENNCPTVSLTDEELHKGEGEAKSLDIVAAETEVEQPLATSDIEKNAVVENEQSKSADLTNSCELLQSNAAVEPLENMEFDEMIEWEDLDDYLIYLEDILRRIHTAYYKVYDQMQESASSVGLAVDQADNVPVGMPDLKTIVPYVRRKVLKGARIVLSGVCPLDTDPATSRIYRVATSLGAIIQNTVVMLKPYNDTEPTTHLVAARLGTLKVKAALRSKTIKVVNPDWLWTCADRWEWVDERLFPLTEETASHFLSRDSPVPGGSGMGSRKKDGITMDHGQAEAVGSAAAKCDFDENYASCGDTRFCNPFGKLSKEEISGMDAEVENILDEESESDDDEKNSDKNVSERNDGLEHVGKLFDMEPTEVKAAEDDEEEEDEATLRQKVLLSFGRYKRKCEEDSSDNESLSGDVPKGWKRAESKRQKLSNEGNNGDREEDVEDEDNDGNRVVGDYSSNDSKSSNKSDEDEFDESVGSIDEEIAAAVEREFLS